MSQDVTFFADGLTEATVRHGVARLSFATQAGDGKATNGFTLAMPLPQVPNLANALIRLLRELEAKAKEARDAQSGGDAQPNGATPTPIPSGLRFES